MGRTCILARPKSPATTTSRLNELKTGWSSGSPDSSSNFGIREKSEGDLERPKSEEDESEKVDDRRPPKDEDELNEDMVFVVVVESCVELEGDVVGWGRRARWEEGWRRDESQPTCCGLLRTIPQTKLPSGFQDPTSQHGSLIPVSGQALAPGMAARAREASERERKERKRRNLLYGFFLACARNQERDKSAAVHQDRSLLPFPSFTTPS